MLHIIRVLVAKFSRQGPLRAACCECGSCVVHGQVGTMHCTLWPTSPKPCFVAAAGPVRITPGCLV